MSIPQRKDIHPGMVVKVIEKNNQLSGVLTEGVVERILTRSTTHPHGIKVKLLNGRVGRVQEIIPPASGETE